MLTRNPDKPTQLKFRIPPSERARLEAFVSSDPRSRNTVIRHAIKRYIEDQEKRRCTRQT